MFIFLYSEKTDVQNLDKLCKNKTIFKSTGNQGFNCKADLMMQPDRPFYIFKKRAEVKFISSQPNQETYLV